jgi:hypothetical protein
METASPSPFIKVKGPNPPFGCESDPPLTLAEYDTLTKDQKKDLMKDVALVDGKYYIAHLDEANCLSLVRPMELPSMFPYGSAVFHGALKSSVFRVHAEPDVYCWWKQMPWNYDNPDDITNQHNAKPLIRFVPSWDR